MKRHRTKAVSEARLRRGAGTALMLALLLTPAGQATSNDVPARGCFTDLAATAAADPSDDPQLAWMVAMHLAARSQLLPEGVSLVPRYEFRLITSGLPGPAACRPEPASVRFWES